MSEMDDLDVFRQMIDDARRVVVFTGAGISTESGIPDFRSPGTGLWNKIKPIEFQDFIASDEVRQESWRRRFGGEPVWEGAVPNKGHEAVAKLVADGKCSSVITQNVDNLFQDSGIPDDQVIELHGNNTFARCLDCSTRYEMAELEQQFKARDRVEPCSRCGGVVKSATISFGQAMPEQEMRLAQEQTLACDLFIVLGSSLVVYPAAGFPELAKNVGARLVILNREETHLDNIADLVLHREIGPSMSYVVGIN
jgi:NAD-dependent deacetylase